MKNKNLFLFIKYTCLIYFIFCMDNPLSAINFKDILNTYNPFQKANIEFIKNTIINNPKKSLLLGTVFGIAVLGGILEILSRKREEKEKLEREKKEKEKKEKLEKLEREKKEKEKEKLEKLESEKKEHLNILMFIKPIVLKQIKEQKIKIPKLLKEIKEESQEEKAEEYQEYQEFQEEKPEIVNELYDYFASSNDLYNLYNYGLYEKKLITPISNNFFNINNKKSLYNNTKKCYTIIISLFINNYYKIFNIFYYNRETKKIIENELQMHQSINNIEELIKNNYFLNALYALIKKNTSYIIKEDTDINKELISMDLTHFEEKNTTYKEKKAELVKKIQSISNNVITITYSLKNILELLKKRNIDEIQSHTIKEFLRKRLPPPMPRTIKKKNNFNLENNYIHKILEYPDFNLNNIQTLINNVKPYIENNEKQEELET